MPSNTNSPNYLSELPFFSDEEMGNCDETVIETPWTQGIIHTQEPAPVVLIHQPEQQVSVPPPLPSVQQLLNPQLLPQMVQPPQAVYRHHDLAPEIPVQRQLPPLQPQMVQPHQIIYQQQAQPQQGHFRAFLNYRSPSGPSPGSVSSLVHHIDRFDAHLPNTNSTATIYSGRKRPIQEPEPEDDPNDPDYEPDQEEEWEDETEENNQEDNDRPEEIIDSDDDEEIIPARRTRKQEVQKPPKSSTTRTAPASRARALPTKATSTIQPPTKKRKGVDPRIQAKSNTSNYQRDLVAENCRIRDLINQLYKSARDTIDLGEVITVPSEDLEKCYNILNMSPDEIKDVYPPGDMRAALMKMQQVKEDLIEAAKQRRVTKKAKSKKPLY